MTKTGFGKMMTPMWSPDGQTLFFASPGLFFGVPITTRTGFKFGPPETLPRPFQAPPPSATRSLDIMPDGRIVGVVPAGTTAGTPKDLEVVVNWFEELKQRGPPEDRGRIPNPKPRIQR